MLDDDDIPGHAGWLSAHMKNFLDPRCLAVSGRHVVEGGREPPYKNMEFAKANVLTYSWMQWQRCYTQVDVRSEQILNIHGTNSAIRRSVLERFGMWDTCTSIEDENSLCFRIQRGKRPDEYMVFDPDAWILRRLDIHGGPSQAQDVHRRFGRRLFQFLHKRHRVLPPHPLRVPLPRVHGAALVPRLRAYYDGESWKYEGRPLRKAVAFVRGYHLAFPAPGVSLGDPVVRRAPHAAGRFERSPQLTPSRTPREDVPLGQPAGRRRTAAVSCGPPTSGWPRSSVA